MNEREQKIQELLAEVERVLMHLQRHVPPEVVELETLQKLAREIKNAG